MTTQLQVLREIDKLAKALEVKHDEAERRIAALEAELDNRRMCVNCGRYAPKNHDRTQPLPECVGPEGLAGCTFNLTPDEAWQHWSKIAHECFARLAEVERERDEARATVERLSGSFDTNSKLLTLNADFIQRAKDAEALNVTLEAENARLREALGWYEEQARLVRLIHSEGDPARHRLAEDGGSRARAALEAADGQ